MLHIRALPGSLTLCLLFSLCLPLRVASQQTPTASSVTIAVADFTGPDKEMGRFLAETLLTDLAQSGALHMVECAETRRALSTLQQESSQMSDPQRIRRLGRLVKADRLVVGSYLVRETQIIVNARLLDVPTGRLIPGGAANVAGARRDLLAVSHQLARLFHQRVTRSELLLDQSAPERLSNALSTARALPIAPVADQESGVSIRHPLLPAYARPNGVVTERAMALLVMRLAKQVGAPTKDLFTVTQPTAPISRQRALSALVKVFASPDTVAGYREHQPDQLPPDSKLVAAWGLPYVAAAVDENWWPAEDNLRPRETATWEFVETLLKRMPTDTPNLESAAHSRLSAANAEAAAERPDRESYTGLIVDAHDLRVQRCMAPRILDEDGKVVYPDPKHVPSVDWLEDHGMVSYNEEETSAKRAGSRPLIVRALAVSGAGCDDLVVSNAVAERIREANRYGKFLWKWAVSVLADAR